MHRCSQSAGNFRVTLRIAHHSEPYHVQIMGHQNVYAQVDNGSRILLEEAPIATTEQPFEGELCIHELAWLEQGVPGKDYRPEYEFTVIKLP